MFGSSYLFHQVKSLKDVKGFNALCLFNFWFAVFSAFTVVLALLDQPANIALSGSLLLFAFATIALTGLWRFSFTLAFLLSTFTAVTTWRLAGLAHYPIVVSVYGVLVLAKLVSFVASFIQTQRHPAILGQRLSVFEWQMFFIRLYIGLDLVPHFAEKLFAGSAIRALDVQAFQALAVPYPLFFVLLAGCVEFFGSLALATGFLTRTTSVVLVIYLLVASALGHHFSLGFIWANSGGGWEYPVLWSVLIFSFSVFGAGALSIDGLLSRNVRLPHWLLALMGGQKS